MEIPCQSETHCRGPHPACRGLLLFFLLVILILATASCSRAPGPVIIFASPDSPRMLQAVAQIKLKLGTAPVETVYVPQFGPEGAETLGRLRDKHPRLLVALGTPALMLVAPTVKTIPVVFGVVANPYFTGAAYEPDHPEIHQENITGIFTPAPLSAALQHGVSLFGREPGHADHDHDRGVDLPWRRGAGRV